MPLLEAGCKFVHRTDDGAILVGNGKMYGFSLKATAADAEVIIYDALSATGTIIDEAGAALDNNSIHITFPRPVDVALGIYVNVTNCVFTGYFMDGAYT